LTCLLKKVSHITANEGSPFFSREFRPRPSRDEDFSGWYRSSFCSRRGYVFLKEVQRRFLLPCGEGFIGPALRPMVFPPSVDGVIFPAVERLVGRHEARESTPRAIRRPISWAVRASPSCLGSLFAHTSDHSQAEKNNGLMFSAIPYTPSRARPPWLTKRSGPPCRPLTTRGTWVLFSRRESLFFVADSRSSLGWNSEREQSPLGLSQHCTSV